MTIIAIIPAPLANMIIEAKRLILIISGEGGERLGFWDRLLFAQL